MKKNDETSIIDLLRNQFLLERDIMAGDLTVLIRTRDKEGVPIHTLKADPEVDDSVVSPVLVGQA